MFSFFHGQQRVTICLGVLLHLSADMTALMMPLLLRAVLGAAMLAVAEAGEPEGAATVTAAACATPSDCNLNGDCVSGACVCDPGWRGSATCGVLTLGAVDKAHRPGISNATGGGYATWGASPIRGPDGKWSVFHAQMSHHCGIFQAWMTNSFIGRSVSRSGDVAGPYELEQVAVPEFSHNPQIRKLPDGSYALFFIGGWAEEPCRCGYPDDGTKCPAQNNSAPNITSLPCSPFNWSKADCPADMPGPSKDLCGPNAISPGSPVVTRPMLNTGCGLATATAKSLDGPWQDIQPLIITDKWSSDNVYSGHTNPSPVFLANGSVIMAFNAGCADPGCSENVGTAISDGVAAAVEEQYLSEQRFVTLLESRPRPRVRRVSCYLRHRASSCICTFFSLKLDHLASRDQFSPFLWQSKRGFHLLLHNFAPVAPGVNGPIAYAHSTDAHTWTLSKEIPADCTLRFTDGSNITLGACGNRPQLAFDENGAPIGTDMSVSFLGHLRLRARPACIECCVKCEHCNDLI
jgi:hypothetical protein